MTLAIHFENFNDNLPRTNGSEDFSALATFRGSPSYFWLLGGIDPGLWDKAQTETRTKEIPGNHSVLFVVVTPPTMRTSVDALCMAALTFLSKDLLEREVL